MFTAYIDDSGTAPEQKVAIATAIVVPAIRANRFQSEWNTFTDKWGISDFHASQCAVANSKYDFAGWDDSKISAAFKRIRQIIQKYSLRAFSLAVNKDHYNNIIPLEDRPIFGNYHYTWAVKNLLSMLDEWACQTGVEYPLEFIFDNMDKKAQRAQRKEIEDALALSEQARPGRFAGRYSFRNRTEFPGLQCVDLLGWACYRFALTVFNGPPLTTLQAECWNDFSDYKDGKWLTAVGQLQKQIQEAVYARKQNKELLPYCKPHIVEWKV